MISRSAVSLLAVLVLPVSLTAKDTLPSAAIAPAINALGLDLYRQQIKDAKGKGVLISPYSIATVLAMTYAGADGETKSEMQRVLRFYADQAGNSAAFQALDRALAESIEHTKRTVASVKEEGGNATPIQLISANRLFVQQGYALRPEFTEHARQCFAALPAELDFKQDPAGARQAINDWIASQTNNRISEALPPGQPSDKTRLALVNTLYLKAAWKDKFESDRTKDEPFHLGRSKEEPVPTMFTRNGLGYAKQRDCTVVTLPYQDNQLQLVLFVPDKLEGLETLEKKLTAENLSACAHLERRAVFLHLPKFKLEPPTVSLGQTLQALGLKSAFDLPIGSANFNRMAPRKATDYLYIGEVLHKTWLSLDEEGTEAAAATIELVYLGASMPRNRPPPPVEVRVDRPFLFAIQHVDSGVCLFLGRVTDPRAN